MMLPLFLKGWEIKMSELIDPMNEDTYHRGAIYHNGIRSYMRGKNFDKFYKFKQKRKEMWQTHRSIMFSIWKALI